MPTSCRRSSLANSVNSGASSWHGTHQEAQTLTTLTLPLNVAGSSPGTWAPLLTRPGSGGSTVCGAGWPISAEGIFEGSPPCRLNQNSTASAAKTTSGSAIRKGRLGGGGAVGPLKVVGSLI